MTRNQAIDQAMRELYGRQGPGEDIDVAAIRAILGKLYDAGQASSNRGVIIGHGNTQFNSF